MPTPAFLRPRAAIAASIALLATSCASTPTSQPDPMPSWLSLESAIFGNKGPGFVFGDRGNRPAPIVIPDEKVERLMLIIHLGTPYMFDQATWLARIGRVTRGWVFQLGTRRPFKIDVEQNEAGHLFVSSYPGPFHYEISCDDTRKFLEICGVG